VLTEGTQNNIFMNVSIEAANMMPQDDPLRSWWLHISHLLTQLRGIMDGYNAVAPSRSLPQLVFNDFIQMNVRCSTCWLIFNYSILINLSGQRRRRRY
jgi:hypothetical protein